MVRTATACVALSLSLGLGLTSIASAEPLNQPLPLTGPMEAVRQGGKPSDGVPVFRITDAKPADASLVNASNGQTVTLEMVQNDVQWREQTAETLQQDGTSRTAR